VRAAEAIGMTIFRLQIPVVIFSILVTFFAVPSLAQQAGPVPRARTGTAVEVQLVADKASYKVGDPIDLRVLLTNTSAKSIYVFKRFEWGLSGQVEIWAKDMSTGKDLRWNFFFDSIPPPPASKKDFLELKPSSVYRTPFRVGLSDIGIVKPGNYELRAIYHSNVADPMFRHGVPSWPGEKSRLQSLPVKISVTS
jgi:hypothetical protein